MVVLENLSDSEGAVRFGSAEYVTGKDALRETLRRMHETTAFTFDVDGFILRGGQIPLDNDGTLDIGALRARSPDTLPILDRTAKLEAHGIPCISISGKSATVALLYEHKTVQTLLALREYGMIEWEPEERATIYPYPVDQIRVNPQFLEPATGRIRARTIDGKPSDLLVFSVAGFDNGATLIDLADPGGFYTTKHFPKSFFEILENPVLQNLLRRTTRQSKIDRQTRISEHHVALSVHKRFMGQPLFPDPSYYETWRQVAQNIADFSYASPQGSKFNLELGLEKLAKDIQLQEDWNSFFVSTLRANAQAVTDIESLQNNLRTLFIEGSHATVTSNYVDEINKGMGARIIIDLNPPNTHKAAGAKTALKYMRRVYEESGLKPPPFEKSDLGGGDGPHRNDNTLICHPRGITNFRGKHTKIDGFPTDIYKIMERFGVQARKDLRDTEETLIFFQLLLHARLGLPKEDLPEETKAKLFFY